MDHDHNGFAPAQDIPWVLMAQLNLWIAMVNQTASSAGFAEPFRIVQNTAGASTRVRMRALAGIVDASLVVLDVMGGVVRDGFQCNQGIRTRLDGHLQPDGFITFDPFGFHRTSSNVYGNARQSTFNLHDTGLLWLALEFTFGGVRHTSKIQSAFVFARVPPHDSPFRQYLHRLGQAFPRMYPTEFARLTCGPLYGIAERATYVAQCTIHAQATLYQQAAPHVVREDNLQLAQEDDNVQLGEGVNAEDIPIRNQYVVLEQAAPHVEEEVFPQEPQDANGNVVEGANTEGIPMQIEDVAVPQEAHPLGNIVAYPQANAVAEVDPQGNVVLWDNPPLGAPHLHDFHDFYDFYDWFNAYLDAIENPIEPVDEAENADLWNGRS